jgi:hypothetical protein
MDKLKPQIILTFILILSSTVAAETHFSISRISTNFQGDTIDDRCYPQGVTEDGSLILFESRARNISSIHESSSDNLFLLDRDTLQFELVSVNPDGNPFSSGTRSGSISNDGNLVAFNEESADSTIPLYLRNRSGAVTRLIDVDGTPADISPDGSRLLYLSETDPQLGSTKYLELLVLESNVSTTVGGNGAVNNWSYSRSRDFSQVYSHWSPRGSAKIVRNLYDVASAASSSISKQKAQNILLPGRFSNGIWGKDSQYKLIQRKKRRQKNRVERFKYMGGSKGSLTLRGGRMIIATFTSSGQYGAFLSNAKRIGRQRTGLKRGKRGVFHINLAEKIISRVDTVSKNELFNSLRISDDGKVIVYTGDSTSVCFSVAVMN